MLNFEQAKKELLYEKERLEIIISAQMELLKMMEKMDGKMYNKKIPDYIETNEKFRSYIWSSKYSATRRELSVKYRALHDEMKNQRPDFLRYSEYADSLFCDLRKNITDEEEKRFSYAKFRKRLLANIAENRQSLEAVKADLATGADRLREICMVMEYYRGIVRGFSSYIRYNHSNDFQIGYIY
ncbi:MAG: hypothetical protein IJ521_01430 [Schwartzia sp.]|nr:hypothetical protein [Schwartzia sp. (in: firmicutes)]